MTKTKISAEVVADSLSPQGDRLTSLLITFPRIILAEVNTHRMLSKNTSSSRAIPFKKMVEAVENDPFIPIAWQKEHKGMQGTEYFTDKKEIEEKEMYWITASKSAVNMAQKLNNHNTTKQLCNRLLEPFMWTTMLITGSKEGWDNFFELRNPVYEIDANIFGIKQFKSKKDAKNYCDMNGVHYYPSTNEEWLKINKGQAEIHIMDLAEKIYDAMNESTPKQLQSGEWHIPFEDKINITDKFAWDNSEGDLVEAKVKISTAMAARTSYTVVGDEKEIDYERMIKLHDKLIEMRHDSPLEHCARAMNEEEYQSFRKGEHEVELLDNSENAYWHIEEDSGEPGWCKNYRGFIQYRHLVEKYLIYKRP